MRLRSLTPLVLLAFLLALAGARAAGAATISPSHLAAGKATTVSIHVPGCHAATIEVFGAVVHSGSQTVPASNPDHLAQGKFSTKLFIKASATSGHHTLTVRCQGANAGAFTVTVTHVHPAAGGDEFRIGKVYTYHQVHAETDGEPHGGGASVTSSACTKQKGKQIILPSSGHVYDAATGNGAEFKLGHDGKFHGDIYIGATEHSGILSLSAKCENQFGLVLTHVHIKFHIVRKPFTNYKTPGQKNAKADHLALPSTHEAYATFHTGANNSNDPAEMLPGTPRTLSVPACEDPKAGTVSLDSPGLSPHKQTSVNRRLPNNQNDTDILSAYSTLFNFTDVVAGPTPGLYPVKISCGTGIVATGKIRITAP